MGSSLVVIVGSRGDAFGVAGEGHDSLDGEHEHGEEGEEDLEVGHVG